MLRGIVVVLFFICLPVDEVREECEALLSRPSCLGGLVEEGHRALSTGSGMGVRVGGSLLIGMDLLVLCIDCSSLDSPHHEASESVSDGFPGRSHMRRACSGGCTYGSPEFGS